ncbi:MAG: hypothetical protein KAQ70_04770 [Candidatus Heimdallarchaeota archaeon]|nr:hypothetical protein [Candidatus Heimdallarchaeota archaeon]
MYDSNIQKKINADTVILFFSLIFTLMIILASLFNNRNYYWWAGLSFIPMLGFSIRRLNYSRIKSVETPAHHTSHIITSSTQLAGSSASSAAYGFSENLFIILLASLYSPFAIVDLGVQISKLTKNKMKENLKETADKSKNIE